MSNDTINKDGLDREAVKLSDRGIGPVIDDTQRTITAAHNSVTFVVTSVDAKHAELQRMQNRIHAALKDPETARKTRDDFEYTFQKLGLQPESAVELCDKIMVMLNSADALEKIEAECLALLESIMVVDEDDSTTPLPLVLHQKLQCRAELIFSQIAPYIGQVDGKMIDYGAGDGQVTQLLHDRLCVNVEGFDIRLYTAPNVTVPIQLFDNRQVSEPDKSYEVGVMTNVLHHELNNDFILEDISRLVQKRLVVIETVPVGDTEEAMEHDKERTFMNDYLYNRLFHNADVPVPGTFETPQAWVQRFADHGWKAVYQEDLGFDQPTIKDRHHLLVLER